MSTHLEHSVNGRAHQFAHESERALYLGTLLQFALRVVIIAFAGVTLLCEPPNGNSGPVPSSWRSTS